MADNETMTCVYCGEVTDGTESREHIVAESLGFKQTLYRGAVCSKCNNDLAASVDGKVFHEAGMAMGVVATGTKGKKGRTRETIHTKKKGVVSKIGEQGVGIDGADIGTNNEHDVSRFLAKAAVNVMTDRFGSESVRAAYPNLIRYVRMPKSRREVWPFEAKYMVSGLSPNWGFFQRKGTTCKSPLDMIAVSLSFASGYFVIPLRHDIKNFNEDAARFIDDWFVKAKKQGFSGFSWGYSAEYNDGTNAG